MRTEYIGSTDVGCLTFIGGNENFILKVKVIGMGNVGDCYARIVSEDETLTDEEAEAFKSVAVFFGEMRIVDDVHQTRVYEAGSIILMRKEGTPETIIRLAY